MRSVSKGSQSAPSLSVYLMTHRFVVTKPEGQKMSHHLCEYSGHISPSSAYHSTFSSSGFPPDSSEGTQQQTANLTKMLATLFPLSKPLNLFHFGDWSKSVGQPSGKGHSHSIYSVQQTDLHCGYYKKKKKNFNESPGRHRMARRPFLVIAWLFRVISCSYRL